MRAPRVLVLGSVLGQEPGGVRRHNAELLPRAAGELAKRGGELLVLEGRGGIAFELPDGITRLRADIPAGPPLARVRAENRFLGALAHGACDLVHGAHLPLAGRHRFTCTLLLHDLRRLDPELHPWHQRFFARMVLSSAVSRARAIATVSQSTRQELASRMGLDPGTISVIPNAADHLPICAREPGEDAPLISVGHIEARKNLALLLHALALDPRLPRLELHGAAKGDAARKLEQLARELGIESRVRLCGPVAESALPLLYARAAAAVFPSRLEGFGIGVLEALRARCPTAVSDIAAHREIAPQAPAFAPDDAPACARAIRTALTSGPAALSAERFSWDRSAQLLVDFWCRAHGGNAPSST